MAAFGCKADVRIEPKPICGSPLTARSGRWLAIINTVAYSLNPSLLRTSTNLGRGRPSGVGSVIPSPSLNGFLAFDSALTRKSTVVALQGGDL